MQRAVQPPIGLPRAAAPPSGKLRQVLTSEGQPWPPPWPLGGPLGRASRRPSALVENFWREALFGRRPGLSAGPRRRHGRPLRLSCRGLPRSSPPNSPRGPQGCKTSWQRVENGVEDPADSAAFCGGSGDGSGPSDGSARPRWRDVGNQVLSNAYSTSPRRSSPLLHAAEPTLSTPLTTQDRVVLHGLDPPLLRR